MESVLWEVLGPHVCNNEKKKYIYAYDKAEQNQIDHDRQLVEGFGSTSSSNSILKTSILVGLTCLRWKTIMSHLYILCRHLCSPQHSWWVQQLQAAWSSKI